ncbi:MAG: hypothetical protein WD226_04115 [Planctomycetota bacterium]
MRLIISITRRRNTGLGFLLDEHPYGSSAFSLSFGKTHAEEVA